MQLAFERLSLSAKLAQSKINAATLEAPRDQLSAVYGGGSAGMSGIVMWRPDGTYEQYLGDMKSNDEMLTFARDSATSLVRALTPRSLSHIISGDTDTLWLVDYYSPHCAPCKHMAGVLRRVERDMRSRSGTHQTIQFGSIDCTRFASACGHIRRCVGQCTCVRSRGKTPKKN